MLEIIDGIRLHIKLYYYKLKGINLDNYYISFKNIPEGLKSEKILKEFKIPFLSIPVPNDIFEACGVAIIVKDYKEIVEILKNNGIEVEVFKYENGKPKRVYGNIEKNGCSI